MQSLRARRTKEDLAGGNNGPAKLLIAASDYFDKSPAAHSIADLDGKDIFAEVCNRQNPTAELARFSVPLSHVA